MVGGDLSLDSLVKIINSVDSGGLGYAFLVSSDGQALAEMTGIPLPARALDSRNSSRLYRGEQAARWADALLRLGGAWCDWYPESEIVGAAEQLGRAQ